MSHLRTTVTPPGPKARELLKKDEKLLSPSLNRLYPLAIERGQDCIVRDVDGNEYLDFNAGLSCLNIGHCHPAVIKSIVGQLERFTHYSGSGFYYDIIVELAQKICDITPGGFERKVFFSNSGSEAVEAAMKLARWHYRRTNFLAYTNSSHGETLGSMSLSAHKLVKRRYVAPFTPGVVHVPYPYCYRCPFNLSCPDCNYECVEFIREYILKRVVAPDDVAGIFLEPIQTEGCITPSPDYFGRLRKLADDEGIALIDDEAETGIGRTGRWFGIEHWQVTPDILCISGGLASGLPIGATLCRSEIMDWEPGVHESVFGGNPLSCAAASATLDVIAKDNLIENATRQGNYILKRLKEMSERYEIIGDARGRGLMLGVELVEDRKTKAPAIRRAEEILLGAFKRGVALRRSESTIMMTPPLTITREYVDNGLSVLEGVLKEHSGTI